MPRLLWPEEHDRIIDLCAETGLLGHARDVRLQGLPADLIHAIPDAKRKTDQLDLDVGTLAEVSRIDGLDRPPLALYLERAGRQVRHVDGADAFGHWALLVRARADASPAEPPTVDVRSDDARERRAGQGIFIGPARVLTAAALAMDGERGRVNCAVITPDGQTSAAVPDRDRSNAGAGWATLVLEAPRYGAPTVPVSATPVEPGASAAVAGFAARVIDPDAARGYDRVMLLAVACPPAEPPPIGAPVMIGGAVVAVVIAADGPFVQASSADGLDALVANESGAAIADVDEGQGALGHAIQLNRESQWYRLRDLVREDRSGLIILHGDATQALHHFVDRMQRDLNNGLAEALTVKRVPYLTSGFGSAPTSAEDWSSRATAQFPRGSGTTVDILAGACDESRLVVVFDAPIRPGWEEDDRALVVDFVEREAPRLLGDVVGYHRLHIMLAVSYDRPDAAFNARLAAFEALGEGQPWTVRRLKQVKFPDWADDVLPFLVRERVSQLDRLRLKRLWDELDRGGRCFDRLARAIQAVLDGRRRP